jgi:serine/threonine-protein kinase HipA
MVEDTFRISLAGAQEKTALLFRDGVWYRPTHTTPTTHILKLPMGINPHGIDLSTSVENEWLCAQVVQAYGVPVAKCWMETFDEHKTLIVERFDRRLAWDASWYLRLPQEDCCQATATPPALKYESDGGPGIRTIMELLLGSEEAVEDRRDFLRT